MNRGVSSGGGKSSLHYLFESDQSIALTEGTTRTTSPPFATDFDGKAGDNEKTATAPRTAHSGKSTDQELDLGKVNRGHPSVKVHSVPGGSSSLGYLFGDK